MGDDKTRNDKISAKIQERLKTAIQRLVWIHDPIESHKSIRSFAKVKEIRVWVLRLEKLLQKLVTPRYNLRKGPYSKERVDNQRRWEKIPPQTSLAIAKNARSTDSWSSLGYLPSV